MWAAATKSEKEGRKGWKEELSTKGTIGIQNRCGCNFDGLRVGLDGGLKLVVCGIGAKRHKLINPANADTTSASAR
jgi:hypothetical protein